MSSKLSIIEDESVLRKVSDPVTNFTDANREFVCDLSEKMKNMRGVGIAAIQVGIPLRIFIMETRTEGTLAIFNPEIISGEKREKRKEGCLSFPDKIINVNRYKRIKVRYQDKEGNFIERSFANIEARIFQHENDHLDGITFLDRANGLVKK